MIVPKDEAARLGRVRVTTTAIPSSISTLSSLRKVTTPSGPGVRPSVISSSCQTTAPGMNSTS